MEGDDCEVRGRVRYAKLGYADDKPYRIDSHGNEILTKPLPIFTFSDGEPLLTKWLIYADGLTQFGRDGQLVSLDEAAAMIGNTIAATVVPEGSWITIEGLGKFKAVNSHWGIDPAERIREARNEHAMLQGATGTRERCFDAHEAYEQDPTEANRQLLRNAYEAVPKHLRMFCGDMDSKDWPIKRILYGDEGVHPRRC